MKTLRLSFNDFFLNYKKDLIRNGNLSLFTSLHGGGEPQVGEVTCQGGITLDVLKIFRFSFPVPVVGPRAKRARFCRRRHKKSTARASGS